MNNFQRIGSISNAHVGKEFEQVVKEKFQLEQMQLTEGYEVCYRD